MAQMDCIAGNKDRIIHSFAQGSVMNVGGVVTACSYSCRSRIFVCVYCLRPNLL